MPTTDIPAAIDKISRDELKKLYEALMYYSMRKDPMAAQCLDKIEELEAVLRGEKIY